VHVVAVLFPEAGSIAVAQFDGADPLGGLPEIQSGNDESGRIAVVRRERLSVVFDGEEAILVQEFFNREIGGEALLAVDKDEPGVGFGPGEIEDASRAGTAEYIIQPRPAGDAVDVAVHINPGKRTKLLPIEFDVGFDETGDGEIPVLDIHTRDIAVMKHRPFLGFGLAGRDAILAMRVGGDDAGAAVFGHTGLRNQTANCRRGPTAHRGVSMMLSGGSGYGSRLEGGDFNIVPTDTLARLEIGGFVFLRQFDSDFVANLHGELVGRGIHGEDGPLHSAWAAVERFDIVAAEIDAIDFPGRGVNGPTDAFARHNADGRAGLQDERVAIVGRRHAEGDDIVGEGFDDEFRHGELRFEAAESIEEEPPEGESRQMITAHRKDAA